MDILDILLDILLKPPQPFIGLFFQQTLVMAKSSNFPNLTWYMHVYNLSAATNRTINH